MRPHCVMLWAFGLRADLPTVEGSRIRLILSKNRCERHGAQEGAVGTSDSVFHPAPRLRTRLGPAGGLQALEAAVGGLEWVAVGRAKSEPAFLRQARELPFFSMMSEEANK